MKPPVVILALAVTALVVAGVLSFTLTVGGSTHDIALDGVDGDELAEFAVRLLEPVGEPSISAAQAEAVAKAGMFDGVVKETVLVRVVRDTMVPPLDSLGWAVNLDPKTVDAIPELGPHSPERQKAAQTQTCSGPPRYMVMFIDATSGEFLLAVQGAGPEIECP